MARIPRTGSHVWRGSFINYVNSANGENSFRHTMRHTTVYGYRRPSGHRNAHIGVIDAFPRLAAPARYENKGDHLWASFTEHRFVCGGFASRPSPFRGSSLRFPEGVDQSPQWAGQQALWQENCAFSLGSSLYTDDRPTQRMTREESKRRGKQRAQSMADKRRGATENTRSFRPGHDFP
jgi:hypothetical protein